ncbi:hypothetical protein HaLaN_18486 [Haematococcus lacustris]|uniref:Uncharacterized protein n=1 Tax=Haematococcus lacustris TaxID=44745 RepID=A0A699ZS42_HAELA|nr:hypothetical protein HaLaN_18486 [Haematococcus lacustris]
MVMIEAGKGPACKQEQVQSTPQQAEAEGQPAPTQYSQTKKTAHEMDQEQCVSARGKEISGPQTWIIPCWITTC